MLSVTLFYVALVSWVLYAFWAWRTRRWVSFFVFGLVFTVVLNSRYILEGMDGGIGFFTGIFDVPAHIGVSPEAPGETLTTCANNDCSVLTQYETHPSWAVAFHERFVGNDGRAALLIGHLSFNTIALILATLQIWRPGGQFRSHKTLGKVCLASFVLSMICAGTLNSELHAVESYGHWWTMLGLYFLGLTVLVPGFLGIRAIRNADSEIHRVWMWRFTGALWGSYWIFRAEMLLVDLLVKDTEGWTLAFPAWTSGLIGIAMAEFIRRKLDSRQVSAATPPESASAQLAK